VTVALGCLILDFLRKEKLEESIFENVRKLWCSGIVITKEIFIHDQLKTHHIRAVLLASDLKIFCYCLLSKHVKK